VAAFDGADVGRIDGRDSPAPQAAHATKLGPHIDMGSPLRVTHILMSYRRTLGWQKNAFRCVGVRNRNQHLASIDFDEPEGAALRKDIDQGADALIESFRPAPSSAGGLGPDVLHEIDPRLVVVRRWDTVRRALQPATGLRCHRRLDQRFRARRRVASMSGPFATMFALWHREVHEDSLGHVPRTVTERNQHDEVVVIIEEKRGLTTI
jgi:hypothetical protein